MSFLPLKLVYAFNHEFHTNCFLFSFFLSFFFSFCFASKIDMYTLLYILMHSLSDMTIKKQNEVNPSKTTKMKSVTDIFQGLLLPSYSFWWGALKTFFKDVAYFLRNFSRSFLRSKGEILPRFKPSPVEVICNSKTKDTQIFQERHLHTD